MDSVTLGELEHGEELRLGRASQAVVGERGQDGGVGAPGYHYYYHYYYLLLLLLLSSINILLLLSPGLVHQLHRGVAVGEAEAPPHSHPEAAVIARDVGPDNNNNN